MCITMTELLQCLSLLVNIRETLDVRNSVGTTKGQGIIRVVVIVVVVLVAVVATFFDILPFWKISLNEIYRPKYWPLTLHISYQYLNLVSGCSL